jgi:hypothetical protein
MKQRRKVRRKRETVKRYRNTDAQRFLDITNQRKRVEREFEEMDRSFDEVDDFQFLTAGL